MQKKNSFFLLCTLILSCPGSSAWARHINLRGTGLGSMNFASNCSLGLNNDFLDS